jgi:hypothetical protein
MQPRDISDGSWIAGTPTTSQAYVTTIVAHAYAKTVRPKLELAERFPALSQFAARSENLPAFVEPWCCRPPIDPSASGPSATARPSEITSSL